MYQSLNNDFRLHYISKSSLNMRVTKICVCLVFLYAQKYNAWFLLNTLKNMLVFLSSQWECKYPLTVSPTNIPAINCACCLNPCEIYFLIFRYIVAFTLFWIKTLVKLILLHFGINKSWKITRLNHTRSVKFPILHAVLFRLQWSPDAYILF